MDEKYSLRPNAKKYVENAWIIEEDHEIHPQNLKYIKEYLLQLKLDNKSLCTIYGYKRTLIRVFAKIEQSIDKLTSEELKDLIDEDFKHLKDNSIIFYLKGLYCFFDFCKNRGYINRNLVKTRWKPRKPTPIPKYLDQQSLAKLRLEVGKSSLRDRTIFEFLLSSGARREELYKLHIEDINLKKNQLYYMVREIKKEMQNSAKNAFYYLKNT